MGHKHTLGHIVFWRSSSSLRLSIGDSYRKIEKQHESLEPAKKEQEGDKLARLTPAQATAKKTPKTDPPCRSLELVSILYTAIYTTVPYTLSYHIHYRTICTTVPYTLL